MQYVKMVLRCHAHMARGIGKCISLVSGMLGRAGDNCFHITQDWAHVEVHRMDYEEKSEIDMALEAEMRRDMPDNEYPYGRSNGSIYFYIIFVKQLSNNQLKRKMVYSLLWLFYCIR